MPRYRYDQLMRIGWKFFLPLSLALVVIVAAVLQLWQRDACEELERETLWSSRASRCSCIDFLSAFWLALKYFVRAKAT